MSWDDYDDLIVDPNQSPQDYIEWFNRSGHYDEWRADSLESTLKSLKDGKETVCPVTKKRLIPSEFVIFDTGLGYHHHQTGQYIDFLFFLDTPLDICLCRRMVRDFSPDGVVPSALEVLDSISFYLEKSRPLFLLPYEDKRYDMALDGARSTEVLMDEVVENLKRIFPALSLWTENQA